MKKNLIFAALKLKNINFCRIEIEKKIFAALKLKKTKFLQDWNWKKFFLQHWNWKKLNFCRCQKEFERDYMEGFDKAKYEADLAAADQDETKKAEIQAGNNLISWY